MLKQLIAALRSGEYTQTTGCLRSGNCYCAAGVACDVWMKETGKGRWDEWGGFETASPDMPMHSFAPIEVYDAYPDGLMSRVIIWNDVERMSFAQIADRLEEWYV